MARKGTFARQGKGFYAPRFSPGVFRFVQLIADLYIRMFQGVRDVRIVDMKPLYEAMVRFQRGETRLVVLFRHVSVADGPVVIKTIAQELGRWCRAHGKPLPGRPHAHFLYGRDVLNWAGAQARWVFPRMGGVPVMNGRVDRESQNTIRRILSHGDFPLAFAPESQVTYHQFTTFDLSAGAGTLAAWAHRDVVAPVRVEVLPLAIGYSYARKARSVLRDVIKRLRRRLGPEDGIETFRSISDAVVILRSLTERFVDQVESEFRIEPVPADGEAGLESAGALSLDTRIARLCENALRVGERTAGLKAEGTVLDRVFRLRAWIFMSTYREDIVLDDLPEVARAQAEHRATLAHAVRPYERLVDILEYVSVAYLDGADGSGFTTAGCDRLIEYGLNLLDAANRACGADIGDRYTPGGRHALVLSGDSINASHILESADTRKSGIRALNTTIRERFSGLVRRLERDVWPE